MSILVLATGNPGKQRELAALLEGTGWEVRLQADYGVPEADETGLTFVENALIKARHAARLTGLPVVADDSGIVVDALRGAPGIHSARFAGPGASDADNLARLEHAMRDVPAGARRCRYVCVLAFLRHADDPCPVLAEGRWEGEVAIAPAGDGGFGYDPLFWLPQMGCTAAQLDFARKQALSHRGQALRELLLRLPPGGANLP